MRYFDEGAEFTGKDWAKLHALLDHARLHWARLTVAIAGTARGSSALARLVATGRQDEARARRERETIVEAAAALDSYFISTTEIADAFEGWHYTDILRWFAAQGLRVRASCTSTDQGFIVERAGESQDIVEK
jgi:hypothetical protein